MQFNRWRIKKERRNTWGVFSYFYLHCYVCLISVTYILYIETCLCVQYSITENLRQMQTTFCSILVILITNKKAHDRHDTNTLVDTHFYNTIVGGKRSVKMRRMILQDFLSVSKRSLETKNFHLESGRQLIARLVLWLKRLKTPAHAEPLHSVQLCSLIGYKHKS